MPPHRSAHRNRPANAGHPITLTLRVRWASADAYVDVRVPGWMSPLTSRLTRPFIVTPADARRGAADLLLVASGVAAVCAGVVHVHVAIFARDHLALDTPWHAFAVFPFPFPFPFPLPLPLYAFVFARKGLLETRASLRMRTEILSGTHPEYHPGDIRCWFASRGNVPDATPLTELDRKSTSKRSLLLRASSAYRSGEARSARLYVGTSAT